MRCYMASSASARPPSRPWATCSVSSTTTCLRPGPHSSFSSLTFGASIYYLIKRCPTADIVALVSAEVGVVFLTVILVTGPIWARPVWGIWWTWDMRLTSTLVLWLIYVSYLFLRRFSSSGQTPLSRRRPGCARRALRSLRLFLDLVLPHAASAACHGRRRIDRSAHAARAAAQLAGFFLLRVSGVLVALSPGETAARGR